MKRSLIGLFLSIPMLIASLVPSYAVEYVRVSGTVANNSGLPITSLSIGFWPNEGLRDSPITVVEIKDDSFSAVVPKSYRLGIALNLVSKDFRASWRTVKTFESDTRFNLVIPLPFKISGKVSDAQGKSLGQIIVYLDEINSSFDGYAITPISQDNLIWNGNGQRHITVSDKEGNFEVYSYPTNQINFYRRLGIHTNSGAFTFWESSRFLVSGNMNVSICIPVNFGASLTLEKNCMEDKTAYELRIRKEKTELAKKDLILVMEDYQKLMNRITNLQTKYPFEKTLSDTKAKLSKVTLAEGADFTFTKVYFKNLNVQLDKSEILWAKTQKTSISCVKGKLIKKVTGIKPKCPTGYMKK
jgi:hypothetical protein